MAIKILPKPMTRGNEIRAMDDEALARFIMQIEEGNGPKFCQERPECMAALEDLEGIDNDQCAQCLAQWLGHKVNCPEGAREGGLGRAARPAEESGGEPNG